jgi:CBS domain-containing protein
MDDWIEEDLSRLVEGTKERQHRVLDERIICEPIRVLDPPAPVTFARTATVAEAVEWMRAHRTGCVLVLDGAKLLGIVTERDLLLKVLGIAGDLSAIGIEEVMTPEPETLSLDDPIVFALNKMSVGGFRHVPLVDEEGRPTGLVGMRSVVDFLVELFPREVLTLPSSPAKVIAPTREGA